jgi:hypothetical protein
VAAAHRPSCLPRRSRQWQEYRPIATFTEHERARRDVDLCNGRLRCHCTPDQVEGWSRSKLSTRSILISVRTLSKSTPGTILPRSSDTMPRCSQDRSVPSQLPMGNGNGPLRSITGGVANQRGAAEPYGQLQRLAQALVLKPERSPECGPRQGRTLGRNVQHAILKAALSAFDYAGRRAAVELADDVKIPGVGFGCLRLQIDRRCTVLAGKHPKAGPARREAGSISRPC